jgi:MFS family permease
MSQDRALTAEGFSVGAVLSTSISVFFRNLVPFLAITAVIGIPYILISFWMLSSVRDFREAAQAGALPSGFIGMAGLATIVLILTNTLSQSAINYGTFQDLRGRRASMSESLGRGFAMMPRVLIGAVLATIAYMIGFMLLIVPGIILTLMWWVFIPVIVVEGAGIGDAFARSRALTSGHRWGILGVTAIVVVSQYIVSWVVGTIGGLLGPAVAEILNLVVILGFTAFFAVLCAVGYYYLRAEKEGIVIDDIARVFD